MKAVLMKKIDGFDKYYISKEGEIMCTDYQRTGKCRMLKPQNVAHGYKGISLTKNKKSKYYFIHRLVAQTFIPNPYNLPQVNHKDEVKSNNNVDNLEWCTAKYNMNYGTSFEQGLEKRCKKVYGYDKEGNLVKTFNSAKEAKRNGYYHVIACCLGMENRKTDKGLRWSYDKL